MINKKLRKSAEGQDCTLQIVGVCNHNPETTILGHLPDETNGMGKKSDDISSCYTCSDCHDAIDGRVPLSVFSGATSEQQQGEKEFYMRRAQTRTLRIWINDGLVKLP